MNKQNSITVIFIFFLVLNVHAQLLWKVSGKDLSKPSYLFGTHHLIEKEKIPDFDRVLTIIPQVDVVVGEIDMSNMLGLQIKMFKECMMKDTTLNDLLNTEDYAFVDAQFKEVVGMKLDKLRKMKPMMLSALYEVKLYMGQYNLKKEPEAVDLVFQKAGRKAKKNILGLETIEQQLDILFNSMSLKRQSQVLVQSVKDKGKSLNLIKQLNEAYLNGDLKMMSQLCVQEEQMSADEKKILIENRNYNWIVKLKEIMPKQSCFVAVGCMHLADETGLIAQLKKAGYTVEGIDKNGDVIVAL